MIDLHAHSTASDGTLTPTELVRHAAEEGLGAIALTDHDTVAGLDEAAAEAKRVGIGFVPGIELEVEWDPGVFHLLGLGLRDWHGRSGERLETAREYRKERNLQMVDLLRSDGIPISYEALTEISGHDTVGRPHFARWLVDHGYASGFQDAFDTMIGTGKPYHRRKRALGVGKTCAIVHEAGGKAIVAHPQSLRISWSDLEKSLKRWKSEGLDGVEAYHANLSCGDAQRIAAMAADLGLIVSAGSDFHGPFLTDRRLGHTCDNRIIDDHFLEPFGTFTHGIR